MIPVPPPGTARVDLHCHTTASFDSVADPIALVARAHKQGLTHVAITDHDTIDGARTAAAAAPAGLHVLVGSEVLTREGDLIFVFLERPLPKGLSARDAITAGREQGALVGIPHPFDRSRRSLLVNSANADLVSLVDWVEVRNGRVAQHGVNDEAAALARRTGSPAIGVSDAHSLLEVGTTWTTMTGDLSSPAGLLEALHGPLEISGTTPVAPVSWWSRVRQSIGRRVEIGR